MRQHYMRFDMRVFYICIAILSLSACNAEPPVSIDRYQFSDQLFKKIDDNVATEQCDNDATNREAARQRCGETDANR